MRLLPQTGQPPQTLQRMPAWGQLSSAPASLGDVGDANQANSVVAASGTILTGTLPLVSHAAWVAAAVPIIGAAVAGVTVALALIFNRKGPQQKVATTHIVDDVEPQLERNRDGYLAGPRTRSSQQQALNNFDAGWQGVVQQCGQAQLGNPGVNCIEDRMPVGMRLGRYVGNGKWNWFAYYRDPIANDPNVQPDPAAPLFGGQQVIGVDPITGQPIVRQTSIGDNPAIFNLAIAVVLAVVAFLPGGSK